MKIIKTSSYVIAQSVNYNWKTILREAIWDATQNSSKYRGSLSPYEQEEGNSPTMLQHVITGAVQDWIPYVPAELKTPEQDLLPQFKQMVREFVLSEHGVDPFMGEEEFEPEAWSAEDIQRGR